MAGGDRRVPPGTGEQQGARPTVEVGMRTRLIPSSVAYPGRAGFRTGDTAAGVYGVRYDPTVTPAVCVPALFVVALLLVLRDGRAKPSS